ncbi:MAG: crosslink repair DNA glycosylase YcaQ family protein [Candidatus Promineifilaceae bacterium]|nr:crosslink repair DNA glycosylase YcaQ family protein [Candidatus Promineifilaceae bacterium]
MIATISRQTYRRFILGRQGLWPGRRWSGRDGTAQALRQVEAVQIDPVSVVAQSHDIVLWGRVLDYQPQDLRSLAYDDRLFFDYGGALFFYPMQELPYWRVRMAQHKSDGRWSGFIKSNPELLEQVRQELRRRGPLRNRDLDGNKVTAYRSSKDTGVAMYALWIAGELMSYGRHGKERIYDFLENIAPPHLQSAASYAEAESYFLNKAIAQQGLITARTFRAVWKGIRDTAVELKEAQARLDQMVSAGQVQRLKIEGDKETYYHLAGDTPHLQALAGGHFPDEWQPIGPTTRDEVTFLSPLEYVSARGRAAKLFDFNYIWEIYKPADKRVYGPYTLPILYGDRLVARMDARHDRPNETLVINGLWLEDWFEPDNTFAEALNKGLIRFAAFLGAEHTDGSNLEEWTYL